jgi:hypothetical protein
VEKDIKIRNGNTSDLGDIMSISKSLDDWTRSFYRKMGFIKHHTEITDNPGCPEELILRKKI